MRTWLNNKHDNSEGNECVCPQCKCVRQMQEWLDMGLVWTQEKQTEWDEKIIAWGHKTDQIEANMKKRFPNEDV